VTHIAWIGKDEADVSLTGGKGASLSRLAAAGLPVPPGFVVTTRAYREFHDSLGLDTHLPSLASVERRTPFAEIRNVCGPLSAALESATLPGNVAAGLESAYAQLEAAAPGATFAVRSSAATEDGAHASFAGLYESYLNLRGIEAIANSVVSCYRCLWAPRAVQYRAIKGFDHTREAMATVVMATVPSAISGVAFTMNPVTGSTDEVLVNASWGLGEAIVSGIVTPDSYTMSRAGGLIAEDIQEKTVEIVPVDGGTEQRDVDSTRANASTLDSERRRQVFEAAKAAEALYGGPVDIEFAFDASGAFFLLQARPVTTR